MLITSVAVRATMLVAPLIMALHACSSERSPMHTKTFETDTDGLHIVVVCERLREQLLQDSIYTQVYGSITITNNSPKPRSYNIRQFPIIAGASRRGEVYYDSMIDYLPTDQLIAPREELDLRVYWGFVGALSAHEIDSLRLGAR